MTMETRKVLINLDSIKPNPNAGRHEYMLPGRRHQNPDGSWTQSFQRLFSVEGEPSHFYEYEKLEVQCTSCNAKFDRSELQTDCIDAQQDEDGEWGDDLYSEAVCPRCGLFNCLDVHLRYERLDEALARQRVG